MEKLVKLDGLKREKGYMYFVKPFPDGEYVCRTKMAHAGRTPKK